MTISDDLNLFFIVDDDENDIILTKELMKKVMPRAKVRSTTNPEDAIRILTLAKEKPDIIFLDIRMPGKTGIALLKELKSDPAFAHVPIVMLTGDQSDEAILDTYGLKASFYIVKPITKQKLLSLVSVIKSLRNA